MIRSLLLAALTLVACAPRGSAGAGPRIAYVTNAIAEFWTIAAAGARAAAAEVGAEVDVRMPEDHVDQQRIVEDLLTRGVDGIAISPIDPKNQIELIDRACRRTRVITHDSDAPGTQRLCYVGMDNYAAGRLCAQVVREALPRGGSIMLFIGRLEQDNGRRRRQGFLDAILDRAADPERYDPPGQALRHGAYEVLDTRTDQFNTARAKENAEDAIARHPDLACMVGFYEYNGPACLEAVRGAGKVGAIQLVAFDENENVLQGIEAGEVAGTVVQDPYRYGYESVRILAALARGDRSLLPPGGVRDIPARVIRRDDVREFRAELRRRLESGR